MDNQNSSTIRKSLKILWLTFVAIITILFAAALAIQLPQVQTYIASKVVKMLDSALDAEIKFEKIHFRPFRTLILKNVEIIDPNPTIDPIDPTIAVIDTLFSAEYITATFSLQSLLMEEGLHFKNVRISNSQMNLVTEDATQEKVYKDNLSRIFRLVPLLDPPPPDPNELFFIHNAEIENFHFRLVNRTSKKLDYIGGINWDDLDIRQINIAARDIQFKGGVMSGIADEVTFVEKSGFKANSISGIARVGNGKTIIESLHIKDPWSDIHMPLFMMSYENSRVFVDFLNKVKLDSDIENSVVDFRTIAYFAPDLDGNMLRAHINGGFSGYISDFRVINMDVNSEAGGFAGVVNGRMYGIPFTEQMGVDAVVEDFQLSSKGLGLFLSEWQKEGEQPIDLSGIAPGTTFLVDATAKGLLNKLNIDASISSPIGDLSANVLVNNTVDLSKPINIKGTAATEDLNLGKVLASETLGPVTLRTGIEANIDKKPELRIDSLFVDRFHFNDYDFSGIKAVGALSENMFNGTIIASDPNLNFILQGGFALSSKTQNSRYKFYANVSDADLHAINLDKRGRSKLRFQTNADFTQTGRGTIYGNIDIARLVFENRDSTYNIGNINLTSHSEDNIYKVRLKSKFADCSFNGTAPVNKFISDLGNITLKKEVPALYTEPEYSWSGNSYHLDFVSHNTMDLLAFIMPGVYIHNGTDICLDIDENGELTAHMDSKRLAIGNDYIKDVHITTDNLNDNLYCEVTVGELSFAQVKVRNNALRMAANDNQAFLTYSFGKDQLKGDRGVMALQGKLQRVDEDLNVAIGLLPSTVHLSQKAWKIQESALGFYGKDFRIDSLEINSGEERIYAYGGTSATQKDTLNLSLDNFDISILNPLLNNTLGLRGRASGDVHFTSSQERKGLLAGIVCDSTYIADEPLGRLRIGSSWNDEHNRFDIIARNELNGKMNLNATAAFSPKTKTMDAKVSLDSLKIKYVQPILKEVFSEMDGYLSGDIIAKGPLNSLDISSKKTQLDNCLLKVAFTNVPYYADGTFHINETGAYFDDVQIKDRYDGTGSLNGGILWNNNFQDITFDTRMKVNNIEGINLKEGENSAIYGHLFASGNVAITGPINHLTLSVDAITAKAGEIHIPMTNAATSVASANLLKFKEFSTLKDIDPYEVIMARNAKIKAQESSFTVELRADVSPIVEAFVEVDKASGNVLSGRGNGLIEMEIGEDLFNINGNYNLISGSYNFSALGLVNRNFTIRDGSSINFGGDIMASSLDINAYYDTKTTLSTLIGDAQSSEARRAVQCGIGISGRLSNPSLDFSIEVPDINPVTKSMVESALSTEDKVQKQFVSLLISNSFLPDEQSGIANNTSLLYSNVTEAMANQISNILHKLDIPLDLGLKYQHTDKGTNIFDVAVSTQLFNNRVIVNGNIGNKQHNSGNSNSNVVGDVDIEVKLNRSGALRLNLFTHSADDYSNFLDNSQRSGVGIMYQTEFNTFREFFRNVFSRKSKREERQLAEQQEMLEGEKVIMKISAKDNEQKR